MSKQKDPCQPDPQDRDCVVQGPTFAIVSTKSGDAVKFNAWSTRWLQPISPQTDPDRHLFISTMRPQIAWERPACTLHTGIPAYTNRNRILARLVASFPLLFTTSSNVLCSKFGGV